MTMIMTDVIKQQHREIEEQFRQLKNSGRHDETKTLRVELADIIAAHMMAEHEQFFTYVLKKAHKDADLRSAVMRGMYEHAVSAFALHGFMAIEVQDERFEPMLAVLEDVFMDHLEEEEFEMLADVKDIVDGQEMYESDVGDKIQAAFDAFMREGHAKLLPILMQTRTPEIKPEKATSKPRAPSTKKAPASKPRAPRTKKPTAHASKGAETKAAKGKKGVGR